MSKITKNYYNKIPYHLKSKIQLPNLYEDLTVDQKRFFDELLDNDTTNELETLKDSYQKIISHIDGFVESLEKVDSILYPVE